MKKQREWNSASYHSCTKQFLEATLSRIPHPLLPTPAGEVPKHDPDEGESGEYPGGEGVVDVEVTDQRLTRRAAAAAAVGRSRGGGGLENAVG